MWEKKRLNPRPLWRHYQVYLTSFIHREDLLRIAERWFCARPDPEDVLDLTRFLICDGFVVGATIEDLARRMIESVFQRAYEQKRIHFKGELRDMLGVGGPDPNDRVRELLQLYRRKPDFYFRDAPINGAVYLDENRQLLGMYRIKRPKRIAEKANRKIAGWIFRSVQDRAKEMAEERARRFGVAIQQFVTPPEEMVREFVRAEESIARKFQEGSIEFDRDALTIHDVGAIKIIADPDRLRVIEAGLTESPSLRIVEKERFEGDYRATNMVIEVPWEPETVCRRYMDTRSWERYLRRGIPEDQLRKGLEPLIRGTKPTIHVEVILSTYPDMVESELGSSIHEERIIAQRDSRIYKGYIPMNVEFLLEYLFAAGFSPETRIAQVPIKLWGRYLPETLSSHIRRLYHLPEYHLLY